MNFLVWIVTVPFMMTADPQAAREEKEKVTFSSTTKVLPIYWGLGKNEK